MPKINYIVGQTIGECIYMGNESKDIKGRRSDFKCKCGTIFNTFISRVKTGHTKTCGCLKRSMLVKRNTTHGLRFIPEYTLWLNMKQRCTNPNYKNYHIWGGRGITICDRWLNSFEKFIDDMGKQPVKRMGIDRIDNDKGYYKENCRWATPKQQNNNKRNNRTIHYKGKSQSLKMWCEELNLPYQRIENRFHRGGKTVEEIFTVKKYNNNGCPIFQ